MTIIKQNVISPWRTSELHTDYEPARAAEWVFLRSEQKVVVADFGYNHPPGFVLNFICFKHKLNRTSTDLPMLRTNCSAKRKALLGKKAGEFC